MNFGTRGQSFMTKRNYLSIRMRIIFKAKYHDVIWSKLEGKLLTSLTKLVLKVQASICSTIRKIYFYIVVSSRHLLWLS